jgi:glycolate oxidase FAD binding subunit
MAAKTARSARSVIAAIVGRDRVRDATNNDHIGGVRPRWVATVDGTDEVAALLRVATEYGLRVIPIGSGSKRDWAAAPDAVDLVLDFSSARGVLEHAAEDLVVTAKAGTPLAEVQRVVGGAGQQLAIDQPLPTATVGGVIATGTSGPGRHLFGGVRDLLIGVTAVLADGTVAVSGGKVVKNVAGYDLGKLYTGSYGTLAVVTEAVFRLHPVAAEHRWVAVVAGTAAAAGAVVDAVRHSQAMPTAIEVDQRPGGAITVCARIEGRPTATDTRAHKLAETISTAAGGAAEVLDEPPPWWGQFPFDAAEGIGIRLDVEPSAVAELLEGAQEAAERAELPLTLRGAAGIGMLHGGLPGETAAEPVRDLLSSLRKLTAAHGGHAVVLRAPKAVRDVVDLWGPIPAGVLTLMRRTKDQFDPAGLLAPGRFVGGI